MRKAILAVFAVFIVVLLGIIGWYAHYTGQIKADLTRFEAESESRKKISVDIAVIAPTNTPKDQILYVSGSVPSLGNWDAAGIPLKAASDGRHHAQVELLSGMEYTFKVTRGTWGTVEADPAGKDIANRTFTAAANKAVEVPVANWIDGGKAVPGRVTLTGDIRTHKKFHSDVLSNERTMIVYLPPNYEKSTDKYPVLYMQDGQNLFDESTSYQGIEWKLDEAAQKLISENKIAPVIIVGIYNTEQRTAEFTPGALALKGAAQADQYAKLVVTEVKPFIDAHYRTQPDREHTAIGGGSQGALVSMYIARQNPGVFGRFVLMSPWLHLNGKDALAELIGDGAWLKGARIYAEMGTEPGDVYPTTNPAADVQPFVAALEKAGLSAGKDFQYREIEGGRHNESAWQNTIEQPLLFLYGTQTVASHD